MNLSPTPSETFRNGLDFCNELCEIQGITFTVGFKEKILKIHDFLALSDARFK